MPLNDEFKQKAARTLAAYQDVESTIDQAAHAKAFSSLNLSSENQSIIESHFSTDSSGARFDQTNCNKDRTFEQHAAHGFVDAIKKSIMFLQNIEWDLYEDDIQLLTDTVQHYNILKDVVHNTKELKLDQKEPDIATQLTLIENEILPAFDEIITELEQQKKINRNDISGKVTEIEHLQRLPENLFG